MLSKRLQNIASLIDKNVNVIDVGCDHALLDIYLTRYQSNYCIASDISEKVIQTATENIKQHGLENQIKTIVSDGFSNIVIPKNTTVVISGMGTNTILSILTKADHTNINNIIIQSNNEIPHLRKNMVKLGYMIKEEIVVEEKKKYYVIIQFIKGKKRYSKNEYTFGPTIANNRDYNDYFNYLIKQNQKILKQLPFKYIIKRIKLTQEIKFLIKLIHKKTT